MSDIENNGNFMNETCSYQMHLKQLISSQVFVILCFLYIKRLSDHKSKVEMNT